MGLLDLLNTAVSGLKKPVKGPVPVPDQPSSLNYLGPSLGDLLASIPAKIQDVSPLNPTNSINRSLGSSLSTLSDIASRPYKGMGDFAKNITEGGMVLGAAPFNAALSVLPQPVQNAANTGFKGLTELAAFGNVAPENRVFNLAGKLTGPLDPYYSDLDNTKRSGYEAPPVVRYGSPLTSALGLGLVGEAIAPSIPKAFDAARFRTLAPDEVAGIKDTNIQTLRRLGDQSTNGASPLDSPLGREATGNLNMLKENPITPRFPNLERIIGTDGFNRAPKVSSTALLPDVGGTGPTNTFSPEPSFNFLKGQSGVPDVLPGEHNFLEGQPGTLRNAPYLDQPAPFIPGVSKQMQKAYFHEPDVGQAAAAYGELPQNIGLTRDPKAGLGMGGYRAYLNPEGNPLVDAARSTPRDVQKFQPGQLEQLISSIRNGTLGKHLADNASVGMSTKDVSGVPNDMVPDSQVEPGILYDPGLYNSLPVSTTKLGQALNAIPEKQATSPAETPTQAQLDSLFGPSAVQPEQVFPSLRKTQPSSFIDQLRNTEGAPKVFQAGGGKSPTMGKDARQAEIAASTIPQEQFVKDTGEWKAGQAVDPVTIQRTADLLKSTKGAEDITGQATIGDKDLALKAAAALNNQARTSGQSLAVFKDLAGTEKRTFAATKDAQAAQEEYNAISQEAEQNPTPENVAKKAVAGEKVTKAREVQEVSAREHIGEIDTKVAQKKIDPVAAFLLKARIYADSGLFWRRSSLLSNPASRAFELVSTMGQKAFHTLDLGAAQSVKVLKGELPAGKFFEPWKKSRGSYLRGVKEAGRMLADTSTGQGVLSDNTIFGAPKNARFFEKKVNELIDKNYNVDGVISGLENHGYQVILTPGESVQVLNPARKVIGIPMKLASAPEVLFGQPILESNAAFTIRTVAHEIEKTTAGKGPLDQAREDALYADLYKKWKTDPQGFSDEYPEVSNKISQDTRRYMFRADLNPKVQGLIEWITDHDINVTKQYTPGDAAKAVTGELKRFTMQLLSPFIKTPINIAREGLGRVVQVTPKNIGDAFPPKETFTIPKALGKDAQYQAYARVMVGTLFTYGLYKFVSSGSPDDRKSETFVLGAYPSDPREQKKWKDLGWQPNDVIVKNGTQDESKWTATHTTRFGPFGTAIAAMTAMRDAKGGSPLDKGTSVAADLGKAMLLSGSNMTSYDQLYTAMKNGDGNAVASVASELFGSTVVPALLSPLQRLVDPTKRDTKSDTVWGGLVNAVANKVPGASKMLPASLDQFGEPITRTGNGVSASTGNALTSTKVNPIRSYLSTRNLSLSPTTDSLKEILGASPSLSRDQKQSLEKILGKATAVGGTLFVGITAGEKDDRKNVAKFALLDPKKYGEYVAYPDQHKALQKILDGLVSSSRTAARDSWFVQNLPRVKFDTGAETTDLQGLIDSIGK